MWLKYTRLLSALFSVKNTRVIYGYVLQTNMDNERLVQVINPVNSINSILIFYSSGNTKMINSEELELRNKKLGDEIIDQLKKCNIKYKWNGSTSLPIYILG